MSCGSTPVDESNVLLQAVMRSRAVEKTQIFVRNKQLRFPDTMQETSLTQINVTIVCGNFTSKLPLFVVTSV